MAKFRAWMTASADMHFTFEVDDNRIPADPDERREFLEGEAYQQGGYVSLCHQCARQVDLGDFELPGKEDDIEEIL